MSKWLCLLLCCVALVGATPQNKSYLQQSSWNGWGGLVDWSFRSLRIGVALQDSLLEDGWLLADSAKFTYLVMDSLAMDSLDLAYIHASWGAVDTLVADSVSSGLLATVFGEIDSVLTASDSLYVGGNATFAGILVADSTVAVGDSTSLAGDSAYFAGNVNVHNILKVDSIQGYNHIHVLDSLMTGYIGITGSILATNNIGGNDLIASDSLMANTVNSTYTVRAGSDVSAWASTSFLGRTVSRNGYLYSCYSSLGMIVYGTSLLVIGHPALAASIPTYILSDVFTGLYYLDQNPDFASSSGWVLSGTSISGGKLNKLTAAGAGTATSTAISNYPILAGATYLLHVDVDSLSAGATVPVTMGGATFATLTAEGSNQWYRATTVNNSSLFSITFDNGETGILDNVYVYRLAGDFVVGGEVWNQTWTNALVVYTIQDGDHVISFTPTDSVVVTLPALSTAFNAINSTGRELLIENAGAGYVVLQVATADTAYNAISGGDSLHLNQFETVSIRAVSARHWGVWQ